MSNTNDTTVQQRLEARMQQLLKRQEAKVQQEKQRRAEKDKERRTDRIKDSVCQRCGGPKTREVQNCDDCSKDRKSNQLRLIYGIDIDEYNRLLLVHNGMCWICRQKKKLSHGVLVVDHDHKTGKVRGLLCDTCNHGLGKFQDSIDLLKNAIEYLTTSND